MKTLFVLSTFIWCFFGSLIPAPAAASSDTAVAIVSSDPDPILTRTKGAENSPILPQSNITILQEQEGSQRQFSPPMSIKSTFFSAYCINRIVEASDKAASMGIDKIKIPFLCLPYWILRNPIDGSQCGCRIDGFTLQSVPTVATTTTSKTLVSMATGMTESPTEPASIPMPVIETAMRFCSAASCKVLRPMNPAVNNHQSHSCSCLFEGGLRLPTSPSPPTCECSTICNVPQQLSFGSMIKTVAGQSSFLCAFNVVVSRTVMMMEGTIMQASALASASAGLLVSCQCYLKATGNENLNIPYFHCDCFNKK